MADAGALVRFVDPAPSYSGSEGADRVDWARIVPFAGMHLACLGVIWVGVSPVAVAVAVGLYVLRMFAITGFYHRYFSHRTFKTSRGVAVRVRGARRLRRRSAARSGGRRITAITTCTPTGRKTCTRRRSAASSGRTWAGSCRAALRARPRPRARPAALPRTALARPLRHPRAVRCWLSACWCSAEWLDARCAASSARAAGRCWCGASSSRRSPATTAPTRSTRCATCGAGAATQTGDDSRNNLAARADHARRGLAQQPPPLPGVGAAGLLLVGNRPHLLRCCGCWPRSA